MYAAIDVGTNTVRMLIGRCTEAGIQPEFYQQKITRLGGGYVQGKGLASESIERTFCAIDDFLLGLKEKGVASVRIVGTAALRRAENSQHLLNLVRLKTRQQIEIITGAEEARLSAAGVLSVISPQPESCLIFDIGGGSTEIVFCQGRQIQFSASYPVGVVALCEEMPEPEPRREHLADMVVKFATDLLRAGISPLQLSQCQLIGTAGTMTTLAALNLQLNNYDAQQINNHRLPYNWLEKSLKNLNRLTIAEREALPGVESGRGDLIIPGLELVLALCCYFKQSTVVVSDAGLLEGILLDYCPH